MRTHKFGTLLLLSLLYGVNLHGITHMRFIIKTGIPSLANVFKLIIFFAGKKK